MKNKLLSLLLIFNLHFAVNVFAEEVHEITQDDDVENKIANSVSGDTIRFYPGTYEVNILLGDKNLTLEGVDTKNTILKSIDGVTPIISVNGAATTTVIQNFTFVESEIGISVAESMTGVSIINNVFRLGPNNTALRIGEFVSADISNNTFYDNLVNIENYSSSIVVKNNIFDLYTSLINEVFPDVFTFNCISSAGSLNIDASNQINKTADFVDVDSDVNDFHLKEDSNCIDKGEFEEDFDDSETDIGAYGGSGYDKIPDSIPVEIINADEPTAIVVSWLESEDYLVAGYKLYYDDQPIYAEAQNTYLNLDDRNASLSAIDAGQTLSATLPANLPVVPVTPDAPTLKPIIPGDNKLALSWNAIEDATSYVVTYVTGDETPVEEDVGDVTSYVITNLSNDLVYTVSLRAKNQLSYYFQVVTYIDDSDDSDDAEFTESYFVREDEKLDIGDPVSSKESNTIAIQPEAIVPYPNLANEGCFIATAAFGYYSVQQVQVLRDFRDGYLLTNDAGRAFVGWYYHYGPFAAAIINEYTFLKPMTRVLLYPLILAAELLEKSVVGFFLYISFSFMLILMVINIVVSQFRKRVSVI